MTRAPLDKTSPRRMTATVTAQFSTVGRDAFSKASWKSSILFSSAVLPAALVARLTDLDPAPLLIPESNLVLPLNNHKPALQPGLVRKEPASATRPQKVKTMVTRNGTRTPS